MNTFKYTYNLDAFDKFFASSLLPKLEPLLKQRSFPIPFYKDVIAQKAFETTCKALGRFSSYKGKSQKNTFRFLKCLHFFPDFTSIRYKGCFKGKSSGREFDVQSIELVKDTGKSCLNVWKGLLIAIPFYKKTAGSVLFQKYDKTDCSHDVVKVILKQREFTDILDKTALSDGQTFLDVIKENYNIVFKSDFDEKEFLKEDFAEKLFAASKKYNCHISLRVLNNMLYLALKSPDSQSGYTSNGWFDFRGDFGNKDFMKNIFQQFETVVMTLKLLNSK